jgi:succinate dehydrogenase / fumarate reductase cytochrome b subunit
MTKQRPTNLAINTMRLPITAYASILHRVSGVIIWVAMLLLLPTLFFVKQSESNFELVRQLVENNFFAQFVVWGMLTALAYYCMGTIKHIVQEFGYFEDFAGGIFVSRLAIVLALVISVLIGYGVWL